MDIQILSESDFSELIGVDLPRREERAARTLETIIQDALAGVSGEIRSSNQSGSGVVGDAMKNQGGRFRVESSSWGR